MAEEFPCCSTGIIFLFFVVFLSNCWFARFHNEVKNHWSFLATTWRSLKEDLNKLLATRFCSKLSSVKYFTQTRHLMLREHQAFSFHFYKPFSFIFWVLEKLESANIWFEVVVFLWRSLWIWKCPAFLQRRHKFISENYPTVFPTAVRIWRIK